MIYLWFVAPFHHDLGFQRLLPLFISGLVPDDLSLVRDNSSRYFHCNLGFQSMSF